MLRGLFITGTGTDVGKTVVSAALMHRYRTKISLRYWKPIQTGIEHDNDTETVRHLGNCAAEELLDDGIRLPKPVSPHLAAELSHTTIRIDELIARIANLPKTTRWIVEGAGGVLVPLNDSELMIDFMQQLQLPTIVVARSELGTINHTLLTLEALRSRSFSVAGVVMVGPLHVSNRKTIEQFGNIAVLGELPPIPSLDAKHLQRWASNELDRTNVLRGYLQ